MLRPPIVDLKMIYTASPMCKVSLVHHPHAHARCETRSDPPPGHDKNPECTTWVNCMCPTGWRVVRRSGCGTAVPMAGRPDRAGEN